jgi:adenylate cyclase
MSFEIERKFLVRNDSWRDSVIRHAKIRQAYLDSDANLSIRVRIKDNNSATLTLKTRWPKLRRREFEYAIPTTDAEELISLRQGHIIEKIRYIVPRDDLTWEIDVFSGENLGLVIAEIELPSENH